ncbi:AEC family transporter [Lacibacterium aquatile]|uniref:AEC family transporter n=1 Tax=Lacibacterium aquatile TaxID=1168082 RepID=A0ABW5DWJ8_9PROT
MQAVFNVALPVFGLILAGFFAARLKLLGGNSTQALNQFVYWFALPSLLFLVMFRAPLERVVDPAFLVPFCLPLGVILLLVWIWGRLAWGLRLADLSVQSLSAIYANVGYMGIPLVLMAFGEEAMPYAIAGTILTGSIMFGLGIMGIEIDLRSSDGFFKAIFGVLKVVCRNPLMLAPALGAALAYGDVTLPIPLKNFLELLGAASSPCALFALGMFLAAQPLGNELPEVTWLTALKLIVAPVATFITILFLSDFNSLPAQVALLLNALPTGAGAFVLAQQYDRLVAQTSATILVSTILSVPTVSLLIALFAH